MTTTRLLSNGNEIPTVGLGTFGKNSVGVVTRAVQDAVDVGYRHFDCAYLYGNEEEVGRGLQNKMIDGTVRREQLFVVTKLWNSFHAQNAVVPMLRRQLKSLRLVYIDLYLIHWPMGFKEHAENWPGENAASIFSDVDYLETWKGMEECVRLGLARNIGVSNFNAKQIERLYDSAEIKPVVNQIEVNPNLNNKDLITFCADRGIVVTAYCPLGRVDCADLDGVPKPSVLDEGVLAIARKYEKSPAQVVLRYLISLGCTVIPKTVTKKRMIENLDVFDFDLDSHETAYMNSLNRNVRFYGAACFKDHKYYPFDDTTYNTSNSVLL